MSVINSTAFDTLAEWAVDQSLSTSSYQLFSVLSAPSNGSTYIKDNTCSTMPWRAFALLQGLGCQIAPLVPPQKNVLEFFVGLDHS